MRHGVAAVGALVTSKVSPLAAKDEKKRIKLSHVRKAIEECGETLSETDMRIFQFLLAHGPHSSSDDKFMRAVGIGRAQLRTRLAEFEKKSLLSVSQELSGTTKKDVYGMKYRPCLNGDGGDGGDGGAGSSGNL